MSIVVRRSRVIPEPRPRVVRFDRQVGPVAGPPARAIDLRDPRHELARLALDLVVRTAEPVEVPARWKTPAFGGEVDRTRTQLGPIKSRDALLASMHENEAPALLVDDGPQHTKHVWMAGRSGLHHTVVEKDPARPGYFRPMHRVHPWRQVHGIPTTVVTGSNGKTTTVRLLAACARARKMARRPGFGQ
jgi:hypothetical protein